MGHYTPRPDKSIGMTGADGASFTVHHWLAEKPRGVVIFLHGLAEHARRHSPFFAALVDAHFSVIAQDYRGHGDTAPLAAATASQAGNLWGGITQDTLQVVDLARRDHAGLPIFLIGYSIGAALAIGIAQQRGGDLAGVVTIGGGGGTPQPDYSLLVLLIQEEQARGGEAASEVHQAMFDSYNRPFEPAATPFDWLSRDAEAVAGYVEDPLCGIPIPVGFMIATVSATLDLFSNRQMALIPKRLPLLIMNGTRDESALSRHAALLINQMAALEMSDVSWRFYPEARHDLLHEVNSTAIYRDIIGWMDVHL